MNRVTDEILQNLNLYQSPESPINSLNDIVLKPTDYPPHLCEDHFDVVLIYAEKDQQLALTFRDILEKFIKLEDGRNARVCVIDKTGDLVYIASKFKHIAEAVRRSTYMFLFMSKHFVNDSWLNCKVMNVCKSR